MTIYLCKETDHRPLRKVGTVMKRSITTFTTTSKYTKQDRALRRNKHYLILTKFVLGES